MYNCSEKLFVKLIGFSMVNVVYLLVLSSRSLLMGKKIRDDCGYNSDDSSDYDLFC